jgi:hypothetical protein
MVTLSSSQELISASVASGTGAGAAGADAQHRAGAPALPPITNRGVIVAEDYSQQIQVGLHWLAVTLHTNPRAVVEYVMDVLIGEPLSNPDQWLSAFVDTGASGRFYKGIYSGPYGITLYAYPALGVHCHLEIKGDALENIGQTRAFEFLQHLDDLKAPPKDGETLLKPARWDAKRVDIAIDRGPFTPRDCYDAFLRRDIRCAASRKSHKWLSNADGDTFYLGSRASGRLSRFYNARGFTRSEIESKGRWAQMIGTMLAAQGSAGFEAFSIAYLRQFVDFVDASAASGSITRAPLLPWWHDFVGDVEKAQLKPDRIGIVGSAAARANAYLERLRNTLCVLRNGLGVSLDQLCDSSEPLLSPKHLQKIADIRRALEGSCS